MKNIFKCSEKKKTLKKFYIIIYTVYKKIFIYNYNKLINLNNFIFIQLIVTIIIIVNNFFFWTNSVPQIDNQLGEKAENNNQLVHI